MNELYMNFEHVEDESSNPPALSCFRYQMMDSRFSDRVLPFYNKQIVPGANPDHPLDRQRRYQLCYFPTPFTFGCCLSVSMGQKITHEANCFSAMVEKTFFSTASILYIILYILGQKQGIFLQYQTF